MWVARCGSGVIVSGKVMHDPVEIRRRIDRLVARVDRRDDYGQLLAAGLFTTFVDERAPMGFCGYDEAVVNGR